MKAIRVLNQGQSQEISSCSISTLWQQASNWMAKQVLKLWKMPIITQLSPNAFLLHWTSTETLAQILQETKRPHVTVLQWYPRHFSSNHSASTYHPQEVTAALPGGFGPRQRLTLLRFEFQYCFITTSYTVIFWFLHQLFASGCGYGALSPSCAEWSWIWPNETMVFIAWLYWIRYFHCQILEECLMEW